MSLFQLGVTLRKDEKQFRYDPKKKCMVKKTKYEKVNLSYQDLDQNDPIFIGRPRTSCYPVGIALYLKKPKIVSFMGFLADKKLLSEDYAVLTISSDLNICLPVHKFTKFYKIVGYEFMFKSFDDNDGDTSINDSTVSQNDSALSNISTSQTNALQNNNVENMISFSKGQELVGDAVNFLEDSDFIFENIDTEEEAEEQARRNQPELPLGFCQRVGSLFYLSTRTFSVRK